MSGCFAITGLGNTSKPNITLERTATLIPITIANEGATLNLILIGWMYVKKMNRVTEQTPTKINSGRVIARSPAQTEIKKIM